MARAEKYVRIVYKKEKDAFDLEISTDGGKTWGMSVSAKCTQSKRNAEADEPEFIHYSIISELNRAVWIGYKYWAYGANDAEV